MKGDMAKICSKAIEIKKIILEINKGLCDIMKLQIVWLKSESAKPVITKF